MIENYRFQTALHQKPAIILLKSLSWKLSFAFILFKENSDINRNLCLFSHKTIVTSLNYNLLIFKLLLFKKRNYFYASNTLYNLDLTVLYLQHF